MKTILIMVASLLLLAGISACAPQKVYPVQKTYRLNGVDKINVDGQFTVKVIAGVKQPKLVINTLNTTYPDIQYGQQGDTMHIIAKPSALDSEIKQTKITLYVNRLQRLQINHANSVDINAKQYTVWNRLILANIDSPVVINGRLHLYRFDIVGNTDVRDNGAIALERLYQLQGTANITLAHVNANQLHVITVGDSKIKLFGKAKAIYASLYQNSMLIGKQLSVKQAFIKAYNTSFANIRVKHLLFAYTTKASRIDYLGHPQVYRRAIQGSAILPVSLPLQ